MRSVKQTPNSHFTSSGYFVALALVLFSGTGLMAGLFTRQVAGALRAGGGAPVLSPADRTATAGANTPTAPGAFELQLSVAPNPVHVGQTLQVTVTAVVPHTVTPVPGVRCALTQTGGNLPLTPWPGAMTGDAAGRAQWSVVVPQTPPGSYAISIRGDGAHGYWVSRYVTLSVTA